MQRTEEESEAQDEVMGREGSIRPTSESAHRFHTTRRLRRGNADPETSSEDEKDSDEGETPEPQSQLRYAPALSSAPRGRYQAPVAVRNDWGEEGGSEEDEKEDSDDDTPEPLSQLRYPPALSSAPRAREATYPPHPYNQNTSESGSGSEEEKDSHDESIEDENSDGEAPRRPIIYEPATPARSRSRTGMRITPERHNFTLSELRARSHYDSDAASDWEDGLSVVLPSKYSDAASSPPRESTLAQHFGPSHHYPSPPPTEAISGDDLADEFGNLACDPEREAYERERRRQQALKMMKRRSAGSYGKRSIAMSMGSDTDDEDVRTELGHEEQQDYGSASGLRRLRRKTLEGNNRASLLFDDPPQRIPEMEEPETDVEHHDTWSPPRKVPDVQQGMGWGNELPYWRGKMDSDTI